MEKRAAKRCQAWNSGERIADVSHLLYHWQVDAVFSPVMAAAYALIVQALICSLLSLSAPSFLARIDAIVPFFLSEKSKEYLS